MMRIAIDRMGDVYGKLTVISKSEHRTKNGNVHWLCQCECGGTAVVDGRNLAVGQSTSCGCKKVEMGVFLNTTHGMTYTVEYETWNRIKARCTNPNNPDYPSYGCRGIKVCERWFDSFERFYFDMGPRPEGMSIDRIDNDGNYEPNNCRWATAVEQAGNKRNNLNLTHNGITHCAAEWSRKLGGNKMLVANRIARGWSVEQTLKEV
jgi:hypothetical protein